jgi:hypothetical protein
MRRGVFSTIEMNADCFHDLLLQIAQVFAWILKTMMQHLERGEKTMMPASCRYMLSPVVAENLFSSPTAAFGSG